MNHVSVKELRSKLSVLPDDATVEIVYGNNIKPLSFFDYFDDEKRLILGTLGPSKEAFEALKTHQQSDTINKFSDVMERLL